MQGIVNFMKVLRNETTGLSLPQAPEFSREGAWPQLTSEWIPAQWALFECETEDSRGSFMYFVISQMAVTAGAEIKTGDALQEDFLRDWLSGKDRQLLYASKVFPASMNRELRRVVHSVRWRRQDPVIQLPPNATHEVVYSIDAGMTIERCQTLSGNLGLKLDGKAVGIPAVLDAQLAKSFSLKVTVTEQRQHSQRLVLENTSPSRYRRYALWNVENRIETSAFSPDPNYLAKRSTSWVPRGAGVEFAMPSDPFITYVEADPM
jgi:hypothetical protein